MSASLEERRLMGKLVRQGNSISFVAELLGFNRKTVSYWSKEDWRSVKNINKDREGKISIEVEICILYMRITFEWGTARIQQGLMNLPDFMKEGMEVCVQGFYLSRPSINKVLKKHKLNGYRSKIKTWKFFRVKKPNELWQLDLKGPFRVEGKKYWILVCIDDYSRFILMLKLFNHAPNIKEISQSLLPIIKYFHPENILTDNNPFREDWKNWCIENKVNPLFAHPYYPQDKGKVERTIRNLAEEFVNLLAKFPQWLNGKLEAWRVWFNEKRFHRGVKDYPANLFVQF